MQHPEHSGGGPDFRTRARRAREERRQQWQAAQTDIKRRVDEVSTLLPTLLTAPIPALMQNWAGTLCRGLMVDAINSRHHRITEVEHARLSTEVDLLLPRIEAGEAGGDDLRRLVIEAQSRIQAANAAEQASLPDEAASLSEYVSDHMRMVFRPNERGQLDQAMREHLQAILDNPLRATVDAEAELGRLELAYADELQAETTTFAPRPR